MTHTGRLPPNAFTATIFQTRSVKQNPRGLRVRGRTPGYNRIIPPGRAAT